MNLPPRKFPPVKTMFAARAPGFLTVCALLLCGCRTAPDLRPFADATSQLSSSIKTTGKTVVSEIDAMSAKWKNEDQRTHALATAEKFEQQWVQRNALADALLDYSASLTAIAQAGEQGKKSAQAVADSFKKLTDAMDVALPQAAAVGQAVKIGSYLYGKFAQDHAAKTLGESMRRLQPTIDETASELGGSLKLIEAGLDAIRDQNAQNIEDESMDGNPNGDKVTTGRNRLKTLTVRRTALLTVLNDGTKTRDDLRADLLVLSTNLAVSKTNLVETADSADEKEFAAKEKEFAAKEKEFARLAVLNADITTELASIEASLKSESEMLAPFDARKAAADNRLATEMELVRTIRAGLDDWAAAHSRLAAAALEKKPLQVEDLLQTALEIRDLVKTVRAGHNQ